MAPEHDVDQSEDGLVHLASAMLASRRLGQLWTLAIARQVGDDYVDNAVVASLHTLRTAGPLRLRDLAHRLDLPGSTLSRVIDRLVALGDVERTAGPRDGDGRAVFMVVTPSGVRREQAIEQALGDGGTERRAVIEDTMRHLEALADHFAGDVDTTYGEQHGSAAGAIAGLGIRLAHILQSISPSGDIAEALTLFALVETSPTRPNIIAKQVGLTSGGTTKVLDRLEEPGLIERTFGTPNDRRGVTLVLTDRGRTELKRILTDSAPHLPALLASFKVVLGQLACVDAMRGAD